MLMRVKIIRCTVLIIMHNSQYTQVYGSNQAVYVILLSNYLPHVGLAWQCCRISPSCFLAECHKRRLNQGGLVLLYFVLFTFCCI